LRREANFSAQIEFLDESEPRELAEQINFILRQAGWKNVFGVPLHQSVWDGVAVYSGRTEPPPVDTGAPAGRRGISPDLERFFNDTRDTNRLAELISQQLTAAGVEARYTPVISDAGTRTVVFQIGRKPNDLLKQSLEELGDKVPPRPFGNITIIGPQKLGFSPDQLRPKHQP
jgi:hypothetical protein